MGRYHNPVYDRLMQQAAVTSDLQARSDLLHEAEQMALDEAAVIPIMYYISKGLVQPYVKGWVPNVKDLHRTRYIRSQIEVPCYARVGSRSRSLPESHP